MNANGHLHRTAPLNLPRQLRYVQDTVDFVERASKHLLLH